MADTKTVFGKLYNGRPGNVLGKYGLGKKIEKSTGKDMKFYSIVDKDSFEADDKDVKFVTKKGRKFATAKYVSKKNGKTYTAYRTVAK
jgi:hypothetical protein